MQYNIFWTHDADFVIITSVLSEFVHIQMKLVFVDCRDGTLCHILFAIYINSILMKLHNTK